MNVEELRAQTEQILAAPEFNYETRWSWLLKILEDIYRFFFPGVEQGGVLDVAAGEVFKWVGLLLLPFLPFLFFRYGKKLFTSTMRKKEKRQENKTPISWKSWIKKAREQAAKQDFAAALRSLYLAALEFFIQNDLLTAGKCGTDRVNLDELSAVLGAENRSYLAFNQLVEMFQERWYGLQECRPADYRRAAELWAVIGRSLNK